MRLCDYGCGKEAKYQFKNGKYCCENSHNKCSINIKKNSKAGIKAQNRPEVKENNSKLQKESWKNYKKKLNRIEGMNRSEVKEKHKKSATKAMNRREVKIKLIKAAKERWKKQEYKEKISNIMKVKNKHTIEQIQEKYYFFSKIEEMRYKPGKPEEREIQVHCKYSECKNSKENGGWFTPSPEQFRARRDALEHTGGNDGRYFYCSEECKRSCCLYYFKTDPNLLTKFKRYSNNVYIETYRTLKRHFRKIKNLDLRGYKHGYELDHKYSIFEGFKNNIDPKVIGHWKNLEVITIKENREKSKNSSISLEDLSKSIKLN